MMKKWVMLLICVFAICGLVGCISVRVDEYINDDNFYYLKKANRDVILLNVENKKITDEDLVTFFKNNRVIEIDDEAFHLCTALRNITLPNTMTEIPIKAFYQLNLESVYIPNSITHIGYDAFMSCSDLKTVHLPENLTTIESRVFLNCHLISINIPSSVTSIGESAFSSCHLTTIILPEGLISIGKFAFNGCHFTTIILPEGLISIGESAFSVNTNLQTVIIPESVETMGANAFYFCTNAEIKCKVASKPSGWSGSWAYYTKSVEWGYEE
ncbi:MAG: leucine-rich repeat domain-containing protein [Bacilli bacterium]|nr:leucine-rich repeat domain-containing protein [Bacilli bacterium]